VALAHAAEAGGADGEFLGRHFEVY
jgi:hypothetical protein